MEQKDYRLAAILSTDIQGFSAMLERDEERALSTLAWQSSVFADVAAQHHGHIIKTMGDGVLADFRNTVEALNAALDIQKRIRERNAGTPGEPLLVRIGIHVGDTHFFEHDALGEGVTVASKLRSMASAGGICLSGDVYNLVRDRVSFEAGRFGEIELKQGGRLSEVWQITGPDTPLIGSSAQAVSAPSHTVRSPSTMTPGSTTDAGLPPSRSAQDALPSIQTPLQAARTQPQDSGDRDLLAEIRSAILSDIRNLGRRMTVEEAKAKYGYYGVEATEVIATLVERGIIIKEETAPQANAQPARGSVVQDTPEESPSGGTTGSSFRAFSGSELGRSIESAVHGIVDEIQNSIESGMERQGRHGHRGGRDSLSLNLTGEDARRIKDRIKAEFRMVVEAGREQSRRNSTSESNPAQGSGIAEPQPTESRRSRRKQKRTNPSTAVSEYTRYRDTLVEKARKLSRNLPGSIASFLTVNIGLWIANFATSGGLEWAPIVTASWGIGLVSHIVSTIRSKRQALEIQAMPEPEGEVLADIKHLNKERDSMSGHFTSTVTVSALLAVINLLVSPNELWFVIPAGAMALATVIHLITYLAKAPALKHSIYRALGLRGGLAALRKAKEERKSTEEALGSYAHLYDEALQAKVALEHQIDDLHAPFAEEIRPDLERSVSQIRLLAQSANEVDRLIEAIPMDALRKDRADLQVKAAAARTDSMRSEYAANIAEIDRQESSWTELTEQSERIKLKLGSSVNQIKQMRLDLARVKAAGASDLDPGLDQIRRRAGELARSIEDMRLSTNELESDPYAELEALEAQGLLPPAPGTSGSATDTGSIPEGQQLSN